MSITRGETLQVSILIVSGSALISEKTLIVSPKQIEIGQVGQSKESLTVNET